MNESENLDKRLAACVRGKLRKDLQACVDGYFGDVSINVDFKDGGDRAVNIVITVKII